MPPRPRPKPKVRSGNNSRPLKETPPSRDEEDSIFIKSGNLTTATWKQMNKIPSGVFPLNRKSFPFDIEPVHESYETYDSGNDENPRKAAKKTDGKTLIPEQYLPPLIRFCANSQQRVRRVKSQFDKGTTEALYIDDLEEESVLQSKFPSMSSKRPRSRSRSITPPPELAPEQERKARNLVR